MRASTEEGNQGRTAPLLRGGSTSAPARWPPITATISPCTPAGNREAVTTHHIRRAAPPLNVAGIYRNLSSSTSVAAHLKRSCNHPKLYDGLHTRYRPSQRRRTTCTTTTLSRRSRNQNATCAPAQVACRCCRHDTCEVRGGQDSRTIPGRIQPAGAARRARRRDCC